MIRFEDVTFDYQSAGGRQAALAGVSFELTRGEALAVLGPNGSGKSTLVRLANGLLTPSSGSVTVEGIDTGDAAKGRDIRTKVSVVYQRPEDQIVATSVEDDVAFGPENLGLPRDEIRRRVDEALAAVGLEGMERREPHLLSGGQKQRLAIAGALAMSPGYVVFDEPTSMLDPEGRSEVHAVIRTLMRARHGIILVTHDLLEASLCERAMVLSSGNIAFDGLTRDLLADPDAANSFDVEVPDLVRLSTELRRLGAPLDGFEASPESMVEALWR